MQRAANLRRLFDLQLGVKHVATGIEVARVGKTSGVDVQNIRQFERAKRKLGDQTWGCL